MGVATSATYKAHPVVKPSVFTAVGVNLALGRNELEIIVANLASIAPDLADSGIAGSVSIDNSTISILSVIPQGGLQKLQTGSRHILFCILSEIKSFSLLALSPFIETLNSTVGTAGKMIMSFDQYPVRAHFKNSAYIYTDTMNEHEDLLGCVFQKHNFSCWWILIFGFFTLDSTPLFRKSEWPR